MIALVIFCFVLIVYACFVTASGQRWKVSAKSVLEMAKRHEDEHQEEMSNRKAHMISLEAEIAALYSEGSRLLKISDERAAEIADLVNERATDAIELKETQATNVLLNQALDAFKTDWSNLRREVETSNAELYRAQEQVESLTLENYGLKEDLEALRAPVVKSVRKRKQK